MSIKKSRLFYFRLFVFSLVIAILLSSSGVLASGIPDEYSKGKENFILKTLGSAFGFLAEWLYDLLGDASMDKLIYGGDSQFGGLSLFKRGDAQNFLAEFYNLFNMVAIIMFIPIVYWSIIAFARAGDSPQGKSILKDRLTKIIATFVFLYTMPELLTILVKVSNTFVDIFSIGTTSPVGEYITKTLETEDGSRFVNGITALMLVGINLWMVFFYIIRDLTISFLFMFFPIVAIWFPLSEGMVISWWKNMASNVLTQPIHAIILSLVITMSSFMNVAGMGALGGLYMIVAFGSIIPMTGIIKGFLGLEGGVGAASSRAGMGGMIAAMGMMRMAKNTASTSKNLVQEGMEEKSVLNASSKAMDKNLSQDGISTPGVGSATSSSDMNRPLTNPSMGNISSKHELVNRKREANKKIAKGIGSLATGTFTGMVGASLGGGLGGRTAMVAGLGGFGLGSMTGGFASENTADIVSGARIKHEDSKALDKLQLESAREINLEYEDMEDAELRGVLKNDSHLYDQSMAMGKDKLLGIHNENITNTPQQEQLRNAMMKQRNIANAGTSIPFRHLSRQALVNNAPTMKSNEQIIEMSKNGSQINLYQDQDMSYLYTTNPTGEIDVLKRGAGVEGLKQPINNPVSFNDKLDTGIPGDYALQSELISNEQAHAYMKATYPDITNVSSEEYSSLHLEKVKELQLNAKYNYKDTIKSARENLGISNLNIQTNQHRVNELNVIKKAQFKAEMDKRSAEVEEKRKSTTYAPDPIYQDDNYHDPVDSFFT